MQVNTCKRCGNCCVDVGRTFWKVGKYTAIPYLDSLQNNGDHEDNGLPCEMLSFNGKKAVCGIHKIYGYEAKPEVCKQHEGDERCKSRTPDIL